MAMNLNQNETLFLSTAVLTHLEEVENMSKDTRLNFNPETRRMISDMLAAGKSVKKKMEQLGVDMSLPQFNPGDENDFLTKQS